MATVPGIGAVVTFPLARSGPRGDRSATPQLGRFFGSSDDDPPAGTPVVVLGDAYWRRTYGTDRSVLGRDIVIGEQPFTIIGIAQPGFNGDQRSAVDIFVPLSAAMRASEPGWISSRGMNVVSMVARGATRDAALLRARASVGHRCDRSHRRNPGARRRRIFGHAPRRDSPRVEPRV